MSTSPATQSRVRKETGLVPRSVGYDIRLGMSGTENRQTKARRYLVEGRLDIRRVTDHQIIAVCRGNGAHYGVGWSQTNGWHCDCLARMEDCCHVLALKLVTTPPGPVRHSHG